MFKTRKDFVFVILAGIFITNAITAELIGGKLIQIGPFVMSIGILPWPIVFLTTDLINEYFGEKGVRNLSIITACLIAYAFLILLVAIGIPAAKGISPVNDEQFHAVFGQSMWIIVGSIIAFLVSQLIDVTVFWFFKNKTGDQKIWLRTTGSTIISQLFDSFIVLGIAFWLPGKINFNTFMTSALTGYTFKLVIAVVLTPLIYFGHHVIKKYLAKE
ncbi:queuosine precursor transporter [Flavobacterium luteum]|uniref:Probable queuosine precursor transporter n=1 Tax=Flavobacterium luteum TaxID=2026654 RepID=A0A7J5AF09_9FLAO|nr:queuosine precursor transporter [Flavobacterium luteum]KAB1156166.1 queuosine precursor transporter [Flavobacterium luteum]